MVRHYPPIQHEDGLETSILGLDFEVTPSTFASPSARKNRYDVNDANDKNGGGRNQVIFSIVKTQIRGISKNRQANLTQNCPFSLKLQISVIICYHYLSPEWRANIKVEFFKSIYRDLTTVYTNVKWFVILLSHVYFNGLMV